jgi:glutathione S-transferase
MAARDWRDTRVRWALEGRSGLRSTARVVCCDEGAGASASPPFGQIPTYEEGELPLFEPGAIIFHIASHHPGLLPDDANARARAVTWIFAASTPWSRRFCEIVTAKFREDKPWSKERMPLIADRIRQRLNQLSARLGDADGWMARSARVT